MALLIELETGRPPTADEWRGYGAGYGHATKARLDAETATLCDRLKREGDISKRSLELQIWWRDHQQHDAEREAREASEAERKRVAASGRSKLTPAERKALGLK